MYANSPITKKKTTHEIRAEVLIIRLYLGVSYTEYIGFNLQ